MPTATSEAELLSRIAHYSELWAQDPTSKVFIPLADSYRRLGLLSAAWSTVEQGLKHHGQDAAARACEGRVQADSGQWELAQEAYNYALSLDAGCLAAIEGLARLYLQWGQRQQVAQLLERGRRIAPQDQRWQDVAQALDQLQGDTEPDSDLSSQPIMTRTLGELYEHQGLPQQALAVYRHLLEANPEDEVLQQRVNTLQAEVARQEETVAGDGQQPASEARADQNPGETQQGAAQWTVSKEEGLVAELERWLKAVQQRRADVYADTAGCT